MIETMSAGFGVRRRTIDIRGSEIDGLPSVRDQEE